MDANKKKWYSIFIGVAGLILFYWILHETDRAEAIWASFSSVIAPFVVGAAIAFIINVPMRSIERRLTGIKNVSLRRVVALLITVILVCIVLSVVFALLIPQVTKTAKDLAEDKFPQFITWLQTTATTFLADNPEMLQWVQENIFTIFEKIDVAGWVQKILDTVSNSLTTIISSAFQAISGLFSIIFNAVISIVFAIYCLFRKEILARQGRRLLYALLPEKVSDKIVDIFRLSNKTFSNFLSGQCLEVCILGIMFAISMSIFRMPMVALVSVLVAVTAFIPLVGAFVGCGVGAFFILVDNLGDPMQAVWFVIMFLILQQIEGNLIYPRVVGTSIGLPGMWVLVAVTVGGELMGVFGMFLMIPLSSVLYALLREYTNYRLSKKEIPYEKLQDQPIELKSGFKEKRERKERAKLLQKLKEMEAKLPHIHHAEKTVQPAPVDDQEETDE